MPPTVPTLLRSAQLTANGRSTAIWQGTAGAAAGSWSACLLQALPSQVVIDGCEGHEATDGQQGKGARPLPRGGSALQHNQAAGAGAWMGQGAVISRRCCVMCGVMHGRLPRGDAARRQQGSTLALGSRQLPLPHSSACSPPPLKLTWGRSS